MTIIAARQVKAKCEGCEAYVTICAQEGDDALAVYVPEAGPPKNPDGDRWSHIHLSGPDFHHYCPRCWTERQTWIKQLRLEGELPTEEIRTAIPDPDAPNPLGSPPL